MIFLLNQTKKFIPPKKFYNFLLKDGLLKKLRLMNVELNRYCRATVTNLFNFDTSLIIFFKSFAPKIIREKSRLRTKFCIC